MHLKRLFPVVIFVLLLLLIGFLLFVQANAFSSSFFPSLLGNVYQNPKYTLLGLDGKTYPSSVEEGFGTKLAVSGFVQKESILKDGNLTIAVPSSQNPNGLWVTTTLPNSPNSLLGLRLENGVFPRLAEWRVVEKEELARHLKPGMQVVLHFDTNAVITKEYIAEFHEHQDKYTKRISGLEKIVFGLYEE